MRRAAAYSYWLAMTGALALMSPDVRADRPGSSAESVAPVSFTRERSGRFGGATVPYTVTAGETLLRGNDGEPKASIFSFAYVRKDVASQSRRPVLFLFNGGPGSPSLWLHLPWRNRRVSTLARKHTRSSFAQQATHVGLLLSLVL